MTNNVLVVPNLYARAWAGEALKGKSGTHWFSDHRAVPLLRVLSINDALRQSAPALVTGYAPADARVFPRLSKAAIVYYMSKAEALTPKLTTLLVDIDYENHQAPPDDWHTEILGRLESPYDQPMWYRTPHGLRLVYPIAEDNQPYITHAQSFLRQTLQQLRDMGVPTDEGTEDWTRLFRLPDTGSGLPKMLDAVPPISIVLPEPLTAEEPTVLGQIAKTARPKQMRQKFTKKELEPLTKHNPRLAQDIYTGRLLAEEGDRHRTLLGAARAICQAYDTRRPATPFEYLQPAAYQMGKSEDELWSICEWAAAAQSGLQQQVKEEREQALLKAAKDMKCRVNEVSQRLIIDTGKEQFVWDETEGHYSAAYTAQHQLLPALDRHCPSLMPEYYTAFKDPIRYHSTRAQKLVYSYDPAFEGFDSHTETMYVRVCRLDPSIVPRYDEEVDEWLAGTFGLSPHYENLLDWLAKLPELSHPICALNINAPAGVGKNLLALGAARLWNRESSVCDYAMLLKDFNQPLLDSPIILADEKVPTDRRGASDSSIFRRVIGNTSFKINAKFRTEATILGYPRVVILANNAEALNINEDLTEQDIDAIRVRIGYIQVPDEAEGFLSKMAKRRGYKTVREMADPWKTEGRIAGHILWLAENREVKAGDRFLVEGWESELTQGLPSQVGSAGMVIEAAAAAINSGIRWSSVRWFGGKVYVSNTLLPRDWENLMPGERMPGNTARLKALKSLSADNRKTLDLPNTMGGRRIQKSYWEIDGALVARVADNRNVASAESILKEVSREGEPGGALEEAMETMLVSEESNAN